MTETDYQEQIATDIASNQVILYMKGTKLMPSCGFSARVVEILNVLDVKYATRNVLEDDLLRSAIKTFSNWPTLPQLYVNGKFVGGCDIVMQMFESGELKQLLSSN